MRALSANWNDRMACDEGQEAHLEKLANTFDGHISNLKGAFGEIGETKIGA